MDVEVLKTAYREISSRGLSGEVALLHTYRMELEPFVFNTLRTRYGSALQRNWDTCEIPKGADKTIVLVERRVHPNLLFCIQNAVYFARDWGLSIVCSDANRAFVEACLGHHVASVSLYPVFRGTATPEKGKKEYNYLLQTPDFWRLFPEPHLLMMETDTYLTKPLPTDILKYDYAASKWPWAPTTPGGGGLSYRKRAVMEHLCSIDASKQVAQDCFISELIVKHGYSYPSYDAAFFGEFHYRSSMCGTHQWWTGIRGCSDATIRDALTLAIDAEGDPLLRSP